MKVAIVAESFFPEMNGVTHSLLKILQHLDARGDEVLVIAPSTLENAPPSVEGAMVRRLPAVPLAGYRNIRVAMGGVMRVKNLLAEFDPDVVHLASPFVLGWRAVRAAAALGIPSVAVYQTDVPGYTARYGIPFLENWAWQRVRQIHCAATKTLVPSSASLQKLQAHDVPRLELWRRGVDTERFHPNKRSAQFRLSVAPAGQRIIGYVGRLALEKQVEDLAVLAKIPGTQLVIVGDGPQREALESLIPEAHFPGFLGGDELAAAMASFDLFVHPGELETFCQTIQEAMASGVPVIATGRGGPVDLVDSSRTGWLYAPGNLSQLRDYTMDLMGDETKRAAFGTAAFHQVQGRSWQVVCEQLMNLYTQAIDEHPRLTASLRKSK
ncbi:glycosyltransferase family 4 protein [Paeniglutamicibacter gangotriensis]|uniref:D-inositol 3-phosphate glycosyltransferase n=1 Tax=Paeniglutamicibacter gangotriensis TaxID=254787 RepID=A0A5B0EFJ1_9MICC|nr:glycosyltransferase family 1 protein [Paeniglutamicibacter gangotriensis]KAA0976581.1 glycosyltransferase family 1 protein [Paeniglutamicibacter gangotriensis]